MKKILIPLFLFALAFVFSANVALAEENWDLTGTYVINYTCTSGCSGVYTHTMNVTSMDSGAFSGTGIYNPNNAYTWDVTGTVSGNDIEFHIVYTGLNPGYTVDVTDGVIAINGTMSGTATSSSSQAFNWTTTSGSATFNRRAEITAPDENEIIYGDLNLGAYLIDNDADFVDWAVRYNTCAAATSTVLGNVDGYSDSLSMTQSGYTYNYSGSFSTSGWTPGKYCFIFNPREDSGEAGIRLTREFYVNNTPDNKDQCKKGGWESFGGMFKNQGDCVSFVATKGKNPPANQ